jgi:uncharacterized protein (TIGR02996 family)
MPPPGYEPFLRAICENPEDDTVRLVYADWLQENGDEDRAEFIRLQIAEQHESSESVRANHLRVKHGRAWRAELPLTGVDLGAFRRGFVNRLHFKNIRFFREHADTMLAATPATDLRIEHVFRYDVSFAVPWSNAWPIRSLGIRAGQAADEVLVSLASSEDMVRLQRLWVEGYTWSRLTHSRTNFITERGILALTRSAKLKHLRGVTLSGVNCSQEIREEFVRRFGDDGRLS